MRILKRYDFDSLPLNIHMLGRIQNYMIKVLIYRLLYVVYWYESIAY